MRTKNNWRAITLAGMTLTLSFAFGQTQVDLRTQSKGVDFSNAPETRPAKTGTVLPAVCAVGDLFFNSGAPAGANLYACTASNTWTLESGGAGGGGSLSVAADGLTVGARAALNFVTGAGILNTLLDTGTQINVQHTADTSVLLSGAAAQSGSPVLCASTSGSASAYTCSLSPTLNLYTAGMALHWQPDVNGSGPMTLNVDGNGAKSIKLADGAADPTSADVLAGRQYWVWYDGSVFRLAVPAAVIAVSGLAQPTCASATRGRLWFAVGAGGVKDGLSVCAKDAADTFGWRVLY